MAKGTSDKMRHPAAPGRKKAAKRAGTPRSGEENGTVLVTGAAGFNGSTAVDLLTEKGCSVIATDLENSDFRYVRERKKYIEENHKRFGGVKLEIIPADLAKKESLRALFKKKRVRYLFHPAAVFNLSAPWKHLYNVNVMGTKNLLDVAMDAGEPPDATIVWSTAMVYGRPRVKGLIAETHPKNPMNHYARSKWEQELMALSYVEKGLRVAALRPAAVYGPRSAYGLAKGFVPMSWSFAFPVVPIPGSGEHIAHYVHVDDIVGAALHLAERMRSPRSGINGESFNVADDRPGTTKDSMVRVARALHVRPPFLKMPMLMVLAFGKLMPHGVRLPLYNVEKDEIPYMFFDNRFDNSKLKATGYEFKYPDPETGMYATLKWYARNGQLPPIWYVTHPGWKNYWKDAPKGPTPYADYALTADS
ncbi:MAG: NAD(P)-dependent oxidoreductase [bacterium]